jgi:hypothetical protein
MDLLIPPEFVQSQRFIWGLVTTPGGLMSLSLAYALMTFLRWGIWAQFQVLIRR